MKQLVGRWRWSRKRQALVWRWRRKKVKRMRWLDD